LGKYLFQIGIFSYLNNPSTGIICDNNGKLKFTTEKDIENKNKLQIKYAKREVFIIRQK